MTLWVEAPQGKSQSCQVWWPKGLWQRRLNVLNLPHDLAKPHNQKVKWLYGWEFLTISHHPAKFCDHRCCGSRDLMFLVVEEQDSTCQLVSIITVFPKEHGISYSNKKNFRLTGHVMKIWATRLSFFKMTGPICSLSKPFCEWSSCRIYQGFWLCSFFKLNPNVNRSLSFT